MKNRLILTACASALLLGLPAAAPAWAKAPPAAARTAFGVAAGQSVNEASQAVIDRIGALGGDGGLIALDRHGNIAQPYNSQGMKRAWLATDGGVGVEVFGR